MQRTRGPLAFLVAATIFLSGCQGALFAGLNSTNSRTGVEQRRGIVFDAKHRLALDVYRPEHAEHAPLVVFFYGGSWTRGERSWYRFVGTALAKNGVVAMIPDYRKLPAVALDGFMHDAAGAVAWARTHAGEFGADAHDVFVMGHSSGGHIAALLATDPHWLAADALTPRDLAGCIGLAGVYTFLPEDDDDDDMLSVFGDSAQTRENAAPVHFVRGGEPPMLLLQGLADHEVDPANALALEAALRAQGEEADLKLYPGIGHSRVLFSMSEPMRHRAPTLTDVLAFVRAHAHGGSDTPAPAVAGTH